MAERASQRSGRWLAPALMTASGFAGLGYQIVWAQQSAVWLGHEAAAVLAVVGAFFGGLSLGAFVLARRIEASAHPGRWYAGCEALIGAWSLLLAVLLQPVGGWLLALIGAEPSPILHWFAAFAGTFLVLLPATVAMGATLPALERALSSTQQHASVALLYAANTCGALLGVLATAFVLVPRFGLAATALICATLNLACAGAALRLFAAAPLRLGRAATPSAAAAPTVGLRRVLLLTGLLGIGYEVLVVRTLSQVAENTVYTFALLLAAYLVGTTAGSAAYPRLRRRCADESVLQDSLLLALAAACLLGTLSMAGAAVAKSWLSSLLPTSVAMALAAEAALAAAAFIVPTFVMGALFTHLAMRARDVDLGFSRALGFNTLGAALAPALFGVLVVPQLGTKLGLLLIPVAYVAARSRRHWRSGAVAVAAAAGFALWLPPLAFVDVPPGGRLVSYEEGVLATVSVVEDARGVARLQINNRQQEGSSATFYVDGRQGLLPLLLHPEPHRVLFLGLGTGATAAAAAAERSLDVDVVELLPEVVAAADYFGERATAPRERLRIVTADARRYVRATQLRYDVIVSDNFHPARSGSAALYTVEHFAAVRERLAPGGLFCQWLPLHQLDLATLRSIVRSFLAAFPQGTALLASYSLDTPVLGLIAAADDGRVRVDEVRKRLATAQLEGRSLEDYRIGDQLALLGAFIAGPPALAEFGGDAPLNTDDRPIVAYRAPRAAYAPEAGPRDRLLELLARVDAAPDEIVGEPRDATFEHRLAAYWQARDRFIAAGRDVLPTSDAQAMLEQVREPLLAALRISPEFRPAYDPLLALAFDVARSDPAAGRALLVQLHDVQPARHEANEALRSLDGAQH